MRVLRLWSPTAIINLKWSSRSEGSVQLPFVIIHERCNTFGLDVRLGCIHLCSDILRPYSRIALEPL